MHCYFSYMFSSKAQQNGFGGDILELELPLAAQDLVHIVGTLRQLLWDKSSYLRRNLSSPEDVTLVIISWQEIGWVEKQRNTIVDYSESAYPHKGPARVVHNRKDV